MSEIKSDAEAPAFLIENLLFLPFGLGNMSLRNVDRVSLLMYTQKVTGYHFLKSGTIDGKKGGNNAE